MASDTDYRSYQKEVERRRLGREEEHGHVRIYGNGEGRGVVIQRHEDGEVVDEDTYDKAEDAKRHLNRIVDEHFQEGD